MELYTLRTAARWNYRNDQLPPDCNWMYAALPMVSMCFNI